MDSIWALPAGRLILSRYTASLAACILLAAFLLACGGDGDANSERVLDLEARAHSQEEALERLSDENARLREDPPHSVRGMTTTTTNRRRRQPPRNGS
jgi:hypothetical protein